MSTFLPDNHNSFSTFTSLPCLSLRVTYSCIFSNSSSSSGLIPSRDHNLSSDLCKLDDRVFSKTLSPESWTREQKNKSGGGLYFRILEKKTPKRGVKRRSCLSASHSLGTVNWIVSCRIMSDGLHFGFVAMRPPSTRMLVPVMNDAKGEDANRIALVMSRTSPSLPNGYIPTISALCSDEIGALSTRCVSMTPGLETEFKNIKQA